MQNSRRKSDRLKLLSRLAQLKEQKQLKMMHSSQAEQNRQRESLAQLQSYHSDYFEQSGVIPGSQQSVQTLNNRMRFLSDLDDALVIQQSTLEQADGAWRQENSLWQTLNARSQRMQKLVDDTLADEQLSEDNKQDKENDDLWIARTHSVAEQPIKLK